MAKLATRRFVPTPEEASQGAVPMSKVEILETLMKYKKQNPAKYAAKKEALFKRYGLEIEDEVEEKQDEEVAELEAIKKRVTKKEK